APRPPTWTLANSFVYRGNIERKCAVSSTGPPSDVKFSASILFKFLPKQRLTQQLPYSCADRARRQRNVKNALTEPHVHGRIVVQAIHQFSNEVPLFILERHHALAFSLTSGLHASSPRLHEPAEMRQIVEGAGVSNFVRRLVDDHNRMLLVRIRIAVHRRHRPRASRLIENCVPIDPRGRSRFQVTENHVAPNVPVIKIVDRELLAAARVTSL